MNGLLNFLNDSLTAYHAVENTKKILLENGFSRLSEREDFEIHANGKYFIERAGAALIAFTVGNLDNFAYKIAAAHLDSPCLKLKSEPLQKSSGCVTLNTETYGGGVWHSYFDRPLKIAGRVVKCENGRVRSEVVTSPYAVVIPSLAIHQQRTVNDGFAINAQIDLQPLLSLDGQQNQWLDKITNGENATAYDLFVVNAQSPYTFGCNDEFIASPRIDNLTSAYAALQALLSHAESDGICVAALLNSEEIGNKTTTGADGNFMETTLKRIAYALRFDDNEFYKALASSFLVSVDNAHAVHPNHPEKSDPTNKTLLGGGVVIKSHAGGAYITDGVSNAVVTTILDKAGVKHQAFFNRSDVRSGTTLGVSALAKTSMAGADVGLAQLAMHSACECFCGSDYTELVNGLTAFYSSNILADENGFIIE